MAIITEGEQRLLAYYAMGLGTEVHGTWYSRVNQLSFAEGQSGFSFGVMQWDLHAKNDTQGAEYLVSMYNAWAVKNGRPVYEDAAYDSLVTLLLRGGAEPYTTGSGLTETVYDVVRRDYLNNLNGYLASDDGRRFVASRDSLQFNYVIHGGRGENPGIDSLFNTTYWQSISQDRAYEAFAMALKVRNLNGNVFDLVNFFNGTGYYFDTPGEQGTFVRITAQDSPAQVYDKFVQLLTLGQQTGTTIGSTINATEARKALEAGSYGRILADLAQDGTLGSNGLDGNNMLSYLNGSGPNLIGPSDGSLLDYKFRMLQDIFVRIDGTASLPDTFGTKGATVGGMGVGYKYDFNTGEYIVFGESGRAWVLDKGGSATGEATLWNVDRSEIKIQKNSTSGKYEWSVDLPGDRTLTIAQAEIGLDSIWDNAVAADSSADGFIAEITTPTETILEGLEVGDNEILALLEATLSPTSTPGAPPSDLGNTTSFAAALQNSTINSITSQILSATAPSLNPAFVNVDVLGFGTLTPLVMSLSYSSGDSGYAKVPAFFTDFSVTNTPYVRGSFTGYVQSAPVSNTPVYTFFDANMDGQRDRIRWVGPHAGILVLDYNDDGLITRFDEMSFTGYRPGATTDMQGLTAFDFLHPLKPWVDQYVLSSYDPMFSHLKMWQDRNSDGISQAGELFSLSSIPFNLWSDQNRNGLLELSEQTMLGGGVTLIRFGYDSYNGFGTGRLNGSEQSTDGVTVYNSAWVSGVPDLALRSLNDVGLAYDSSNHPTLTTSGLDAYVLDLDGNGIETLTKDEAHVAFDVDNDGYIESSAWVNDADGLLAIDWNGDGEIESASELVTIDQTQEANRGSNRINYLDSNGDGRLDSADGNFSRLLIWRDANADGTSQVYEIKTLAELGITSVDYALNNYLSSLGAREARAIHLDADSAGSMIDRIETGVRIRTETGEVTRYDRVTDGILIARERGVRAGTFAFSTGTNAVLQPNIQDLILTGSADLSGSGNALDNEINGNAGDNVLSGSDGSDRLYGGAGNDTLDGGAGNDHLAGEAGDDFYIADTGDIVIELLGDGHDTVTSAQSYTLTPNVEDLILVYGAQAALIGTGNDLDNGLFGNDLSNTLFGLDGNDTLEGGEGADTLVGGTGDDRYIAGQFAAYQGNIDSGTSAPPMEDLIIENDTTLGNIDTLRLGGRCYDLRQLERHGNDLVIRQSHTSDYSWDDFGGYNELYDSVRIQNYFLGTAYQIEQLQFVDASTLSLASLVAKGYVAAGTSASDSLFGGVGNDILDGGAGIDSLSGGPGNDTLEGGGGMDFLYGDQGDDLLRGGAGSDYYYGFGAGLGQDRIQETGGNGLGDTAQFTTDPLQLTFSRSGNDLRVNYHGATDSLTIENWYAGTNYQNQVGHLWSNDGASLYHTQVDQLIQAMATFSTSHGGISWDQAITQNPNEVQAVLAAYWQPPEYVG